MGPKASDRYWSPLSETTKKSISEEKNLKTPGPLKEVLSAKVSVEGINVQPKFRFEGLISKSLVEKQYAIYEAMLHLLNFHPTWCNPYIPYIDKKTKSGTIFTESSGNLLNDNWNQFESIL